MFQFNLQNNKKKIKVIFLSQHFVETKINIHFII